MQMKYKLSNLRKRYPQSSENDFMNWKFMKAKTLLLGQAEIKILHVSLLTLVKGLFCQRQITLDKLTRQDRLYSKLLQEGKEIKLNLPEMKAMRVKVLE